MPISADYSRSNRYRAFDFFPDEPTIESFDALIAAPDAQAREQFATSLIGALSSIVGVSAPRVLVLDAPRPHRVLDGHVVYQRLGSYSPRTHTMRIHNRTARIEKQVAPKTFADTVLHELLHHWDFELLKLTRSLHTSGFYYRLGDLKRKLRSESPVTTSS
jgi:hypothetical protein